MKHIHFWPGWETGDCLGRGGFGTVYEIHREVFGDLEQEALKIISIPQDNSEVEYMQAEGMDADSITKAFHSKVGDIIREYKIMAKLKDNPNIVHCDDFRYTRHEDGLGWDVYIKMELLTPLLKTVDNVVAESDIVRLGVELCNALRACQEENLIHRDIKPQNIFLSPKGIFKLGDFGISRTMEHTTVATASIGAPSFMAPEVARGEKYDQTVDIYSLGLVLYWLLNERRLPFLPLPPKNPTYTDNDMARIRRLSGETLPRPKNGSEELVKVVMKACAFRPEDRYQNAQTMWEALEKLRVHDRIYTHPIDYEDGQTIVDNSFENKCDFGVEEKVQSGRENNQKSAKTEKEQEKDGNWNNSRIAIIAAVLILLLAFLAVIPMLIPSPQNGWVNNEDGSLSYYIDNKVVTGMYTIDEAQYYFDDLGVMYNGLLQLNEHLYFFDENGVMQTGFVKVDTEITEAKIPDVENDWMTVELDSVYYFSEGGAAVSGWQTLEGKEYYFEQDHKMTIGWKEIGEHSYYFLNDGTMATGEIKLDDSRRATFDTDGKFVHCLKTEQLDRIEDQRKSGNKVKFTDSHGKSNVHYVILNKPVKNCTSITVTIDLHETDYTKSDGKWRLYIVDEDNRWKDRGLFYMDGDGGTYTINFDKAEEFQLVACARYGGFYSGDFDTYVDSVTYYY